MLRALLVSFATLTVSVAPLSAEGKPQQAIESRDGIHSSDSPEQPRPQSSLTDGKFSGEDAAAENELLAAANRNRVLAGIAPLRMDEGLRQAARAHAVRLVASATLEHQLAGEPALLERIAQASPLKLDRVGENLANATCAPDANEVLMNSPPHRKNLLDSGFNLAGIVAVWSKGRLYVVQDFAHEVSSYSPQQSAELVGKAIDQTRQQASLPDLQQLAPPDLDQAACSLSTENHLSARLLATAYSNRKIITYTQSRPEVLPPGALRLLRDPALRQFAVGACYARNATYPTGTYWIAILLY